MKMSPLVFVCGMIGVTSAFAENAADITSGTPEGTALCNALVRYLEK